MGEGGYIALINGTDYVWRRTHQWSYQFNSWDFPEIIHPGEVRSVYIEYDQGVFTTRSDTAGDCTYSLDGVNGRIVVRGEDKPSHIKVKLENIETPNNPTGSWIHLGWAHDGVKYFILSGRQESFSSVNPPSDWMHQNLKTLGSKTLSQICMPGTHDAGMGEITWSDNIPEIIIEYFTRTQSRKVYEQLQCGSRYFDIRPEISSGQVYTGHYTGKLGARGQSLASIIDDVNAFTSNNKELIVINLSHAANSDDNFRGFNQSEWNRVMEECLRINHLFIASGPLKDDLSLYRLDQLISVHAAVIVVVEGGEVGSYGDRGFYLPSQLNVYNEYADSNDCVSMKNNQIGKMLKHSPSGDKRLFLLSWTLTQQFNEVMNIKSLDNINAETMLSLMNMIKRTKSIKEMAYSANKALFTDLFPQCSKKAYPNIIYIDFMENNDYAALAMAVNHHYAS